MYNFNENNIVVGYIKELLHNFNLPTCEVFIPNQTTLYPNTNYIYNNYLIKTRSNVTVGDKKLQIGVNPSGTDNADYVKPYTVGDKILNITKTLKLNSILYDTYTHEYLGNYLRFYRDYFGIDLMMLYNCFSNRLVDDLIYNNFNASDNKYKIYAVPIKFNKKYLVGIDSDTQIELACGLFDDNLQITSVETGSTDDDNSLYNKSYKVLNSMQFMNPIEYSLDNVGLINDELLKKFENCLKLFIKLPAQNRSAISIVEVSAPSAQFKQMVDGNVATMATVKNSNNLEVPSKLSLFKMNDGVSRPFADRLLEFLFGQAIDSNEQIGENIERVQKQLLTPSQYYKNGVRLYGVKNYGVWDNDIRNTCYTATTRAKKLREVCKVVSNEDEPIYSTFNLNTYDITGYVDKDIEQLITVVPD